MADHLEEELPEGADSKTEEAVEAEEEALGIEEAEGEAEEDLEIEVAEVAEEEEVEVALEVVLELLLSHMSSLRVSLS